MLFLAVFAGAVVRVECKSRSFPTAFKSPSVGDRMRSGVDNDEANDEANGEDENFPFPPDVSARDSTITGSSKAVKRARCALRLAVSLFTLFFSSRNGRIPMW
jgi:hypothetical protein